MFKTKIHWQKFLLVLVIGGAITPVYAMGKGAVVGQVVDTGGIPLADVTVSVKDAPSVTTNPGGMYVLSGVKQKRRVLVTFEKAGYALTQATVSLVSQATRENDDQGDEDDLDEHHEDAGKKIAQATLNKTMLKNGVSQTLDTATGGVLTENGFKVTFAPNSLTATGNIDVVISPIDVSTGAIAAAPGDFSARTLHGKRVTLESFSMASFTLTQNGLAVNLNPGATADIELLLPANTPLVTGDVKPLWYFNLNNGLWQEEGAGTVGASTTTPGRLAVFATVKHFTWWNSDQRLNSTAVRGKVVDKNGVPIAGASVQGYGVSYAGHSYAVPTDANGNFCIQVRSSSTTSLAASNAFGNLSGGFYTVSTSSSVTTGPAQTTCAGGGAQQVPNLVLATALSCISGDVKDANGLPVAGALVYSTGGGFATTDANGLFQLPAPENTSIQVFSAGYAAVAVTTPAAGSACTIVALRPGTVGNACLMGTVYQCTPTQPYPGVVLSALHPTTGILFSKSAPSTANGTYCIDGLPTNTVVAIHSNSISFYRTQITTGNSGSCATNSCQPVPPMNVYCY